MLENALTGQLGQAVSSNNISSAWPQANSTWDTSVPALGPATISKGWNGIHDSSNQMPTIPGQSGSGAYIEQDRLQNAQNGFPMLYAGLGDADAWFSDFAMVKSESVSAEPTSVEYGSKLMSGNGPQLAT